MASLLRTIKAKGNTSSSLTTNSSSKKEPVLPPTPLELLLRDAPPLRDDGRGRFFGLENFGSTCYGSSILQCLFYSIPFREQVISFPVRSIPERVQRGEDGQLRLVPTVPFPQTPEQLAKAKAQAAANTTTVTRSTIIKPEDKESQEYKKKQVLNKGPLWALRYDNASSYGMKESLYTCMKDLFEAIAMNQDRMGIIAPYKFYEIMRSSISETWGGSQHQDAHEFLNLLLNSVVDTVEATAKSIEAVQKTDGVVTENGTISKAINSLEKQSVSGNQTNSRWVHELFEGTLTSETKCLTCENTSKRDEPFLDLSVDLDAHSSVTSCLRRFSEEEMLKEKDKFFCDNCGGLQEAEKRMKIKRLPRILALHLKRFRYTEDMQRMNKLFHRITYPEQLRLFNTTEDAEDPDRLYELYAVVVHIGAGPYHGHYVSIIKTRERGWLLFDDELVEPVDKSYVMNFFGDKSSLACAYVLFYQETTAEAVKVEQEAEGRAAVAKIARPAPPPPKESHGFSIPSFNLIPNGLLSHSTASPSSPTEEQANAFPPLSHAITAPLIPSSANSNTSPLVQTQTIAAPQALADQAASKKERQREEKERKLQEKEAAKAEKNAAKEAKAKAAASQRESSSWNFLQSMNQQMSPSTRSAAGTNGTAARSTENSLDTGSSEHSQPSSSHTDVVPGPSTTSHPTGPTSSTPTEPAVSPNPLTTSSPNSSGGGAFSRFRQSSRSLRNRPKFWPGGSTSTPNPPVPQPNTSASNGHAIASASASHAALERKSDDYAVDDSDTGSATGAPPGDGHAIPRSSANPDEINAAESSANGEKSSKKRTSRFSLRRKGSNMLSFSAGSDK